MEPGTGLGNPAEPTVDPAVAAVHETGATLDQALDRVLDATVHAALDQRTVQPESRLQLPQQGNVADPAVSLDPAEFELAVFRVPTQHRGEAPSLMKALGALQEYS